MKLNEDKVPASLEEAVSMLHEAMSEEEEQELKTMAGYQLHFSLGMYLRNQWSLWEKKNVLVKWFKKNYKIDHADDISGLILDCYLRDLNDQPRRAKELAQEYVDYWKNQK